MNGSVMGTKYKRIMKQLIPKLRKEQQHNFTMLS